MHRHHELFLLLKSLRPKFPASLFKYNAYTIEENNDWMVEKITEALNTKNCHITGSPEKAAACTALITVKSKDICDPNAGQLCYDRKCRDSFAFIFLHVGQKEQDTSQCTKHSDYISERKVWEKIIQDLTQNGLEKACLDGW